MHYITETVMLFPTICAYNSTGRYKGRYFKQFVHTFEGIVGSRSLAGCIKYRQAQWAHRKRNHSECKTHLPL